MKSFNETGLGPEILKAISEIGFDAPTPIQAQTIPFILDSTRDLVALAQTGTGKTAAFSLPVLQQIDLDKKRVQMIVLCPTRELCMQIAKDMVSFTKYTKKLDVVAVYGGTSIDKQIKSLRDGAQVVAGTPGRVIDLIKRRALKLEDVRWLVLDEADEMLNMGFKEDLDTILAETPEERQTLLFSATMPKEIQNIARRYMKDPHQIEMGKRNTGAANVEHLYYMVNARDRYNALKRIADVNPDIYGIVFCRTRRETQEVADSLIADGYNADSLHGDLSQAQRDQVMGRFRSRHLQMLVATDVAARGLDVNDLTHVINYNLPDELEAYIHRSGRTGRAGKSGISVTIIHSREQGKIRQLEKKVGKSFTLQTVPGGEEICEVQLFHLIDTLKNIEVDESTIGEYLPAIYEKLGDMSREELIKKFVFEEFNRFLKYYKNAPDLNAKASSARDSRDGRDSRDSRDDGDSRESRRRSSVNFARFHVNIGAKQQLNAARLIGLINEQTSTQGIEIGKIEILNTVAFFEIDERYSAEVEKGFYNATFEGNDVRVEPAKSTGKPTDFAPRREKKKFKSGGGGDFGGYGGGFAKKGKGGKSKPSGSASRAAGSRPGGGRSGGSSSGGSRFDGGGGGRSGGGKKRR